MATVTSAGFRDGQFCPLCCESTPVQDRQYAPCECGYQICFWCHQLIKRSVTPNCPWCRRPYNGPFNLVRVTVDDAENDNGSAPGTPKSNQDNLSQSSNNSTDGGAPTKTGRKIADLREIRVIRKTLCYVVGLSLDGIEDEELKSFKYFGKYGKILSLVVNKNPNFKSSDRKRSCAVYVNFSTEAEAKAALADIDGAEYDGRRLKASFGTTKYCSSFIKGTKCLNKNCLYLHEEGTDQNSFTTVELARAKQQSKQLSCSALLANELKDLLDTSDEGNVTKSNFGKDESEMTLDTTSHNESPPSPTSSTNGGPSNSQEQLNPVTRYPLQSTVSLPSYPYATPSPPGLTREDSMGRSAPGGFAHYWTPEEISAYEENHKRGIWGRTKSGLESMHIGNHCVDSAHHMSSFTGVEMMSERNHRDGARMFTSNSSPNMDCAGHIQQQRSYYRPMVQSAGNYMYQPIAHADNLYDVPPSTSSVPLKAAKWKLTDTNLTPSRLMERYHITTADRIVRASDSVKVMSHGESNHFYLEKAKGQALYNGAMAGSGSTLAGADEEAPSLAWSRSCSLEAVSQSGGLTC